MAGRSDACEECEESCIARSDTGAMNKDIHGAWTGPEILLLDYEGAAKALSLSRAALRDLVYKDAARV